MTRTPGPCLWWRKRQLKKELYALAANLDAFCELVQRRASVGARPKSFKPLLSRPEYGVQLIGRATGLLERERNRRTVAEHRLCCNRDCLFDLGRRYSPSLLGIFRFASDQSSRNVIAVAALTFRCALYVQRLAALVE